MATYSHSRLTTFEQCRQKYKFQYIDKIKVDIPTTIEAFMGDMVHQSLEKLYSDLKFQKLLSLPEVLDFYRALWDEEWDDKILIVKKSYTSSDYKKMGEKYISDYYNKYHPFTQMTILGLETQDVMILPDGNHYHVRIDKLGCVGDTYFICDYKTNSYMKAQEEADNDRQLAMYSIWVKNRYKDAKSVVLLWHMLAFNKIVTSIRTEEELQILQDQIIRIINEIEKAKEYPTTVTKLCDYCVFQSLCPAFTHKIEVGQKSLIDFNADDGVKLVDELSVLQESYKEIEEKIENIKLRLISFSKKENASIVYGTTSKASIKEFYTVKYPQDKEEFIRKIKEKGLYDEYSSLNYMKLNSKILKNEIDEDIIKMTEKKKDYRISISKK